MQDIIYALRMLANYLSDQRAKNRFKEYENAQPAGVRVIKIPVESATRVGYVHIFLEVMIRSYWSLKNYFTNGVGPHGQQRLEMWSKINWQQVCEYEAVLRAPVEFSLGAQADKVATMAMSWLWVVFVRHQMMTATYDVVYINTGDNVQIFEKWSPSMKMEKLRAGEYTHHKLSSRPGDGKLTADTLTLITRLNNVRFLLLFCSFLALFLSSNFSFLFVCRRPTSTLRSPPTWPSRAGCWTRS
jgi:hypothetical protein